MRTGTMCGPSAAAAEPTVMPSPAPRHRTLAAAGARRGLPGFAALVAAPALAAVAAGFQAVAAARDRRTYPPPGQLVDAGGPRLHLHVAGTTGAPRGRPTVVLDAGIGSCSPHWAWVQEELAPYTRVVAYDRAGLGWSDPGPRPRDARRSAAELRTALERAGIGGPYVVAGHSYGGLVVRAFADLCPDDVVGMVLVDASHPDQWAHIPAARGGRLVAWGSRLTGVLARLGLWRLLDPAPGLADGLPARQAAELRALLARPGPWAASADALAAWEQTTRPQINGARGLGALPLAVLSVTEQARYAGVLTRLQADLPSLSSNSVHRTVHGATHEGLVSRREHALVVADAIRRVAEAARTGLPLGP
jgi:pimeloyl-ACP methyl ester carboxylesterase